MKYQSLFIVLFVGVLAACGSTVRKGSESTSLYTDYLNRDVRDDIFYFVMPEIVKFTLAFSSSRFPP